MKKYFLFFVLALVALPLAGCKNRVRVELTSSPVEAASLRGAGTYSPGEEITVSARPEPGWEFVGWTQGEEAVAATPDYTFVVRNKIKLTANFQPLEYAVSALAQGRGSVRQPGESASYGRDYSLSAIPEGGYRFVCWIDEGEIVGYKADYTFTVAGDRELTALFWPDLDLEVGEGGRVEEAFTLEPARVSLKAVPAAGYEFFGWLDLETGQEAELGEVLSFTPDRIRRLLARFRQELVSADGSDLAAVVGKTTTIGRYAPADLVELPSSLSVKGRRVRKEVAQALEVMAQAARAEGVVLDVDSGYRSYSTQDDLFYRYAKRDGVLAAERYSARPGQSEHQLGTAVDFGGTNKNYSDAFADTAPGKWLAANAHNYGFALSYPRGKEEVTGYMFEPWHYRYVGLELAREWKETGLTLIEFLSAKGLVP